MVKLILVIYLILPNIPKILFQYEIKILKLLILYVLLFTLNLQNPVCTSYFWHFSTGLVIFQALKKPYKASGYHTVQHKYGGKPKAFK